MSTDANNALVQGYFAVLNDGLVDIVDKDFFTDDYRLHLNSGAEISRATAVGMLRAFMEAFPGIFHSIEDQFAVGDRVVTRIVVRGVHQRQFGKLAATNKEVAFNSIYIHRIVGDRIAEHWIVSDQQGMLRQLGVIPAAG